MLKPLFDEITSSKATIIKYEQYIGDGESYNWFEVLFNGAKSTIDYYENQIKLNNHLKLELENSIDEKSKKEKLSQLNEWRIQIDHLLRQFRIDENGFLTTSFLKKEIGDYKHQGVIPYDGYVASDKISEFISIQKLILDRLVLYISEKITYVSKQQRGPEETFDLPEQTLMIYLLNKHGEILLKKIHQDQKKQARLLSALLNRSHDNLYKSLLKITKTNSQKEYFKEGYLKKILPVFKDIEMNDIVNEIENELGKVGKAK